MLLPYTEIASVWIRFCISLRSTGKDGEASLVILMTGYLSALPSGQLRDDSRTERVPRCSLGRWSNTGEFWIGVKWRTQPAVKFADTKLVFSRAVVPYTIQSAGDLQNDEKTGAFMLQMVKNSVKLVSALNSERKGSLQRLSGTQSWTTECRTHCVVLVSLVIMAFFVKGHVCLYACIAHLLIIGTSVSNFPTVMIGEWKNFITTSQQCLVH